MAKKSAAKTRSAKKARVTGGKKAASKSEKPVKAAAKAKVSGAKRFPV